LFYSILPEGAVEAELKTFGTLDNSRDTDYGYVVVLTVDAAKLGAKTAPYYFELNAENGKPEYILQATADNKVVRKTLAESSLGEIELITEANCQEVGYGSYAYSEGGQVVFYAGVTEIGGAHEFVDDVCVHCGAYRVSQALVNTVTLNANEFVELSGTYNGDLHKEIYNGVTIRVTAGDHWYWSRSDAYIAKDDYGSNIDAAEIWHSLDDPEDPTNYALRTPVGKLNGVDGEAITEDSFKEAMQNGAFRYRVSYADGVVTIVHSLYKQGESAAPYFSFTVKISDIQRSSVTIAFGLDAAQVTGNVWYANGKVANDMIEEFPNDAFTLKDVSWTVGAEYEKSAPANGTVAVAGNGVATLLDAAHRTALGADAKYTHYIAFAVKFAYEPVSDVFVRVKANGETLKGSVAEIDGNMLYVIIPTDGTVTDYVLDFASTSGNTEQCDVALELSGVVASSVTTSVSGSANLITGGEVTIVYSGVTVTDNDEIEINGISFKKSELTGNKDYGNGVTVKSATASGTAFT
ncbi:MAG: hypothetical protein K2H43_07320, partial [Clostridia bacterium]|nr:hypothetical protein [Clostridia bacterium]